MVYSGVLTAWKEMVKEQEAEIKELKAENERLREKLDKWKKLMNSTYGQARIMLQGGNNETK